MNDLKNKNSIYKNMSCRNCGKIDHYSNKCNLPILSYGIIKMLIYPNFIFLVAFVIIISILLFERILILPEKKLYI